MSICVSLTQNEAQIDWGDMTTTDVSGQQLDDVGAENCVDFDIEAYKSEICVEGAGVYIPSDGVAKGDDALTIIEWVETRNLLMNDLLRVSFSFDRNSFAS